MRNLPTKPEPFSMAYKALRFSGALLVLAVLYIALVGIAIDASSHGREIADKLSSALGREVRFVGPMQLEISARPKLQMGGLHIANAPGFGGGEFASLGEARLALDLWPLLWGHLQIEELAGSDVRLRLQAHLDGNNNWSFKSSNTGQQEAPAPGAGQAASNTELGRILARLDIQRVSLEKLDVEYIGGDTRSHYFNLNSLVAHFPSGQPVSLKLNGTVEKIHPYQIEFTGGMIADLPRTDRPWPVDLSLSFLSSHLSLKGGISGSSGSLHFGLATQHLDEFERLLQTKLPPVGNVGIAGDMAFAPGKIALANLSGNLGNTTLNGALDVDYGGARPKVRGQLTLPVLDLRPFMTGQADDQEEPAQSLADMYRELAKATFNLKELNSADADLTLRVGKWINIPGAVRDAMLQVKLEHGRLTIPIQATMADVALSGNASADASRAPARFNIALGTHDSSLGNLAGLLLGMPDVKGQLGSFNLRLSARGDGGAALMQSLDVKLEAERGKLSYGNSAGSRPVQFSLDKFVVSLPAGKALQGEARGSLLDKPFSMSLRGASLTELMQETNAPVDFALQAGSATVQVHALLQPPTESSGPEITFALDAPHSGEVSTWLGLKPGTDVPVSLKGNVHLRKDSWHLADFAFQLGHSALSADVRQILEKNKPLVKLQLTGDLIDADELQSLVAEEPASTSAQATPAAAALIDIPILPQGISLADADIMVRIKRIATTSPFAVHDLRFDGNIRDGMMSASPFSANVAKTDFSGAILLDMRTQQPRSELWLAADAVDVGNVLEKLDIARKTEAHVDHLRIYLDLHSSKLGQLLAQSKLEINFDGGYMNLRDANTGGEMRIALDNGELKSAPGAAVHLSLNGSLDKAPLAIEIQTASAVDLLNPALSIPFKLSASTSGATLQLSGDVDRPFSQQDVELALDMRGTRFDNLNALAHTSLPPWGPWSASGKFHMSPGGYEVSSLLLQVGSSQLNGHGKLDTKAVPPRLDIELAAPTIQIDDFRFGKWSPEKSQPAAAPDAQDTSKHAQKLLSRKVLQRQDAYLVVHVDQVLSGKDALGNGKLEAKLQNGRADIGPVVVNTPGGSAMFRLGYEPGENDVALNLRAEAKHFDYGILARRIDKHSDMRGTFDLDVDINAHAKQLSELMRNGKGHIDFAVWPENMKSGLLDVWAVNVLMALLPAVDSTNESKVNCAIGQFTLQDGKLSHKRILVDTTRMRVFGKGSADFNTEQLQFYMKPRSKTPQFLSFAIPIQVSGSFDDFSVGVRPGDVLELTGDLFTSVIWVPLQSLFGKTRAEDGRDVCKFKQ